MNQVGRRTQTAPAPGPPFPKFQARALIQKIAKLSALLPKIALQQYINKCLIDEIVITNNIEGAYSTRKEIGEILDDLEGKSKNRFFGLVNKYAALQSKEDLSIQLFLDSPCFTLIFFYFASL